MNEIKNYDTDPWDPYKERKSNTGWFFKDDKYRNN